MAREPPAITDVYVNKPWGDGTRASAGFTFEGARYSVGFDLVTREVEPTIFKSPAKYSAAERRNPGKIKTWNLDRFKPDNARMLDEMWRQIEVRDLIAQAIAKSKEDESAWKAEKSARLAAIRNYKNRKWLGFLASSAAMSIGMFSFGLFLGWYKHAFNGDLPYWLTWVVLLPTVGAGVLAGSFLWNRIVPLQEGEMAHERPSTMQSALEVVIILTGAILAGISASFITDWSFGP